ncbi:S53 family peptidase [Kineosporia mesophila]|uniref:S53 family peptidase n=1 Tax=Kineosporia mesophila TaxID=566012 RepID=A0ABP6ZX50_9ACTN
MRSSLGRPKVGLTVAVASSLALVALSAPAALADQGPPRVPVDNAQPELAGASVTGTAKADTSIAITVHLKNRNQAALTTLIDELSDPTSANYGKYLSAAQFTSRFGPTAASVKKVENFLDDSGLTVTGVAENSAYIEAKGPVSKVQKAFDTTLKTYKKEKVKFRAASTKPSMPSDLQNVVLGVSGLASVSDLMKPASTSTAPPSDAFVNATPCSSYYGQKTASTLPSAYGKKQPYAPCGYVPDQLQGAYGVDSSIAKGLNGKGVTVAITDAYASPTARSDANTYATRHGQKALTKSQYTEVLPSSYRYGYDDAVNGDQCGEQGWYGEQTLDIEAVHATAPGANIKYVASPSCDNTDFVKTLIKVVSGHLADIVTNSWGGVDESNGSDLLDQVYEATFEQAAAQGIGFYFSSGDSGDGASGNDGTPTTQAPANSPYVTAVGGTSLAVNKRDNRSWETGWSTARSALSADGKSWDPTPPGTYQYGAGGGTSRVFAQPKYQKGVVPKDLATRYSSTPARVVPDVSALGDPNTGMLVGQTQTFPDGTVKYSEYRIGGTSLASPLFAGVMAIADQAAGRPHGFANPALYRLYGSRALYDPKPKSDLGVVRNDYVNGVDATDGTTITLRSIDVTTGTILRTRRGYDDITGIGSPNGTSFIRRLS